MGLEQGPVPDSLGDFGRQVVADTMFGKKDKPAERPGFIKRLRARLNRGDSWLTYDLANLAPGGKIDEHTLEELESMLAEEPPDDYLEAPAAGRAVTPTVAAGHRRRNRSTSLTTGTEPSASTAASLPLPHTKCPSTVPS